jgi:hypothetical protein
MQFVKLCRETTRYKDRKEIKVFVKDLYEEAEVLDNDGRTKAMHYRLPLFNDFAHYITKENNKVCRKGLSTAYGFSVKMIQTISASKKQGNLQKFLQCTQSFTDATIHKNNFAQTTKAFQENLVGLNFVGTFLHKC